MTSPVTVYTIRDGPVVHETTSTPVAQRASDDGLWVTATTGSR